MTINNGYCTLQELKDHLASSGDATFTTNDDANMEIAIEAVSRVIDSITGTNYYGVAETRYFTARFGDLLYVDDLISITTLKADEDYDGVYETTWTTTDYILEPRNARVKANASDREPYRQIRTNWNGDYVFPGYDHAIEIVGTWGYTTVAPAPIKQATLLAAHRMYKRKDSIFGVAGTPQLGVTIVQAKVQQDSDIMLLLNSINQRVFYG